jgi:hypothetical protein
MRIWRQRSSRACGVRGRARFQGRQFGPILQCRRVFATCLGLNRAAFVTGMPRRACILNGYGSGKNHAAEFSGSTAAPAVVRRALAPNLVAPGRTEWWVDFVGQVWGARARPTATGAVALPIASARVWLRRSGWTGKVSGVGWQAGALRLGTAALRKFVKLPC